MQSLDWENEKFMYSLVQNSRVITLHGRTTCRWGIRRKWIFHWYSMKVYWLRIGLINMKNVPSGSLKAENFLTSSVIKTMTFSKTNFPPPLWSKLVRKMNFPFPFLWITVPCHWAILSWHCFEILESRYPFTQHNNPEEQNSELAYLTLRLLMSYIYGAHILDVSRSHTTTHHSR